MTPYLSVVTYEKDGVMKKFLRVSHANVEPLDVEVPLVTRLTLASDLLADFPFDGLKHDID